MAASGQTYGTVLLLGCHRVYTAWKWYKLETKQTKHAETCQTGRQWYSGNSCQGISRGRSGVELVPIAGSPVIRRSIIAEYYMLPFSQAQRTRIHQFGTHCRVTAEAGPTLWGQTVWGQNARVASLTNGDIEMHIGHLTKRCHMLINRTIKSLQARHLSTGNMTYASYWLYVGITCKLKRWQVNECGGLMCLLREVYFVICDTFMLHTLLSFDNWVPAYSTFPSE